MHIHGGNGDKLGVTAIGSAAHKLGRGAKVVPPGHTRRALLAADAGIDHYPVAHLPALHAGADRHHLAGAVAAQDQRRRKLPAQTPAAGPGIKVEAVQGRRLHFQLDLPGLGFRFGPFPVNQRLRAAVGFNINCLHKPPFSLRGNFGNNPGG